jgi:hypothetical protein
MLRTLFGIALALRLLVDMATPLMPGAFRFDPHESVEALQTHSVRAASHTTVRPGPSPQRTDEKLTAQDDAPARGTVELRTPRFRPLLARHTLDRSVDPTEDH